MAWQTAAVKVTAFRTPYPPITDNFAFRFETPDGVIVVSSDTNFSPKLAKFARGARRRGICSTAAPRPTMSVLSHLVPGELDVTDEDWRGEASKTSRTRSASLRDLMELKLLV